MDRTNIMKQKADFQEGISQGQSTATPFPTPKLLTTNESFQMRYYSYETSIIDMKQNADFQEGISQALSTATPLPTPKVLTTNESFKMRYYIRIFFKGHENCKG